MIVLQGQDLVAQPWHEAAFMNAVALGQIHPATPASVDGGQTWITAAVVAHRLQARGDDGIAFFVPMRTEGWSLGAGYLAIFSGLFFGGPLCFAAPFVAAEIGPSVAFKLCYPLVALLLGPLPPAAMALLGLRALRRDPTCRGKGRAIFALVVAALMALCALIGLGRALIGLV